MTNHPNKYLREAIVNILGLEVAPDGQPDMYLTRDESGTVLEGSSFATEVDELEALVSSEVQKERQSDDKRHKLDSY